MSTPLTDALTALADAARTAGIDEAAARAEGEAMAATVAERSTGAFVSWCEQTDRERDAEAFMIAAKRGNRFRAGPTPLLGQLQLNRDPGAAAYADALHDIAAAAVTLGAPNADTAGVAIAASAAQRGGSVSAPVVAPITTAAAPTVREPVRSVSDELLAGLEERSRGVLDMLRTLNPPTGADPIVAPDPTSASTTEGQPPPMAAAPPDQPADPAKPAEPEVPPKTVEELLAELDELVGLTDVKAEIRRQAAVLRVEGLRKTAGLASPTITRHLVFNGNPGTGKTTVARLVAGIYRALGLLSKGQLIEVDRSELVAGFLGQTAMKTAEVVKTAIGGVLFIDEAYSLVGGPGDQYGLEAIDTLVKEMEDHRGDLVVIVAGYPVPMAAFIAQNPGLASRFRTHINFPDYTDDELVQIFEVMAKDAEYDVDQAVLDRLQGLIGTQVRDSTFGNARYVRNVLEAAVGQHAWRLRDIAEPTLAQLRTLVADDFGDDPRDGPKQPVEWPEAEALTPGGHTDTDTDTDTVATPHQLTDETQEAP